MLPFSSAFSYLDEDEDEEPGSTRLVNGEIHKLEFGQGTSIEETRLIITERVLRIYWGWGETDFLTEEPLMQIPVTAIDTVVETSITERLLDLPLDD